MFNWLIYSQCTIRRRSNQLILKEINPECLLEGLLLKLQHFGHPMQRADLQKKPLMLGKMECKRRRGQKMRCLDSITDSVAMNLSKLGEIVEDRGIWCAVVHRVAKSQTWLSNWTLKQCHLWIWMRNMVCVCIDVVSSVCNNIP